MDIDDVVLELESLKKELDDAQKELAALREQLDDTQGKLDDAWGELEPCVLVHGGPLNGSLLRSDYLPTDEIAYKRSRGWYNSSGYWHEETSNEL